MSVLRILNQHFTCDHVTNLGQRCNHEAFVGVRTDVAQPWRGAEALTPKLPDGWCALTLQGFEFHFCNDHVAALGGDLLQIATSTIREALDRSTRSGGGG